MDKMAQMDGKREIDSGFIIHYNPYHRQIDDPSDLGAILLNSAYNGHRNPEFSDFYLLGIWRFGRYGNTNLADNKSEAVILGDGRHGDGYSTNCIITCIFSRRWRKEKSGIARKRCQIDHQEAIR